MKMTQNLISMTLSDAELAEMDAAISTLEATLSKYTIDLSVDERRSLAKMGDKSEAFCRQTLNVLSQNPSVVPAGLDLAEAKRSQGDEGHTSSFACDFSVGRPDAIGG
jgi:hypothetical protein